MRWFDTFTHQVSAQGLFVSGNGLLAPLLCLSAPFMSPHVSGALAMRIAL